LIDLLSIIQNSQKKRACSFFINYALSTFPERRQLVQT
jgi:hypothetical protein